jgi:hypothetical protein
MQLSEEEKRREEGRRSQVGLGQMSESRKYGNDLNSYDFSITIWIIEQKIWLIVGFIARV